MYFISFTLPVQDPIQLRFLVVINPFSGRKQGLKQYRQNVEPFFEIAGVTVVEELVTGMCLYCTIVQHYSHNMYW